MRVCVIEKKRHDKSIVAVNLFKSMSVYAACGAIQDVMWTFPDAYLTALYPKSAQWLCKE